MVRDSFLVKFKKGERYMLKKEEIKIIVVEPSRIYERIIKNRLDDIYGIVYYPYREVEILKNVYIIYSFEVTKNKDKIFERNVTINGINIYGKFVIVGKKNNELISLTKEQVEDIKNIFERKE